MTQRVSRGESEITHESGKSLAGARNEKAKGQCGWCGVSREEGHDMKLLLLIIYGKAFLSSALIFIWKS